MEWFVAAASSARLKRLPLGAMKTIAFDEYDLRKVN
jgi:hypothetical protein